MKGSVTKPSSANRTQVCEIVELHSLPLDHRGQTAASAKMETTDARTTTQVSANHCYTEIQVDLSHILHVATHKHTPTPYLLSYLFS